MRRFEGLERGKRRFYEVETAGKKVVITSGILDGSRKPETTTDEWHNSKDASAALEAFIGKRLEAGFKEVKAPPKKKVKAPPKPGNVTDPRPFERAILEDRDDPTPWLVYADALQAAGDPRGELIVVRRRDPRNSKVLHAEDRILDTNLKQLVGAKLLEHLDDHRIEVTWKYGFFESASMDDNFVRYRGAKFETLLSDLVKSPSARFLDSFTCDSYYSRDLAEVAKRLPSAEPRPPLRVLTLTKRSPELIGTVDAIPLLAAFPALRELSLDGVARELNEDRLRLEVLELAGASSEVIAAITSKPWPNLRRLVFGADAISEKELAAIFEAKALPNLTHLGLPRLRNSDAVVSVLTKSPLFQRLASLDLPRGTLTPKGAAVLAGAKRKKKLTLLEVPKNRLDPNSIKSLSQISEKVLAAAQRKR